MKRSFPISFLFFFLILLINSLPISAEYMSPGVDLAALPEISITASPFDIPNHIDSAVPDLFTGSMKYSIPILVPVGRKGLEPKLNLKYRSNQQNGWVGVGWELELGDIERNSKKGVNYEGNDYILRMNGTTIELVNNGDGTYRPVIENSFLRIVPSLDGSGRPSFWEVTDKSGVHYFYGRSDSTRQNDPSDTSKKFKWCLDRVEDTTGNYIEFSYEKDQGQIYPKEIQYTGNGSILPSNKVTFVRDSGDSPRCSPNLQDQFWN